MGPEDKSKRAVFVGVARPEPSLEYADGQAEEACPAIEDHALDGLAAVLPVVHCVPDKGEEGTYKALWDAIWKIVHEPCDRAAVAGGLLVAERVEHGRDDQSLSHGRHGAVGDCAARRRATEPCVPSGRLV